MLRLRKSHDRGHADHGWLESFHTFSFAEYQDPRHMGFRSLRVINEDRVQPGGGFGMHPHRDMEIISYVVSGAMEHRDSQNHRSVLTPGEVQQMSAGRGILHSEMNASQTEGLHFLQIWILPRASELEPRYQQVAFTRPKNGLTLLASPDRRQGSVGIHQDVTLFSGQLDAGHDLTLALDAERHGWLQLISGSVVIQSDRMDAGDGCAISDLRRVKVNAFQPAEFLFFDLN